MAEKLNFTKAALEAIKPTQKRQFFQDTREPDLRLYVTKKGAKTFYAQLYVNGQTIRYPVGHFPALKSITLARNKAKAAAGMVAEGKDPRAEKSRKKALSLTLEAILAAYLRDKDLKPGTKSDYKRAIEENYGDWLKKPLANITGPMIQRRYVKRSKVSRARTDNGFRVLKAIFNYAKATYREESGGLFNENPTLLVQEAGIRNKPKRKRRKIESGDLAAWWGAVHGLQNFVARDLLLFLALTGARRTEAASLRWEEVDLRRRVFRLVDTKNREVVDLPLPRYMAGLLAKRKGRKKKGWVFPAPTGKRGYLSDPRKSIEIVKNVSKIQFSPHDLRRTYVSTANSLDINAYTVKWLINHKFNQADVTAGYDIPDLETLRAASAKVEDRILRLAGVGTAKVIPLRKKA